MEGILTKWRRELRGTFSANSATVPQWEIDLAQGVDGGYFAPDSAAWAVHGSMSTLVAGIHSLLLQALHPGALAGVHDHSNYKEDPLGRLAGTIRWIFTLTYGDTAAARAASERVLAIHEYIRGSYITNAGVHMPYTANDPDLLRWVHLAFTQAFLASHLGVGKPIPGGPDAYVADWAIAGSLMRVSDPPRTAAALAEQLAEFSGELRYDERVAEIVAFIRKPPLPRSQRLGYRVLFAQAVATLNPEHRKLLGLRGPILGGVPLRLTSQAVLGIVRLGLGQPSPSEVSARTRRARLGIQDAPSQRG